MRPFEAAADTAFSTRVLVQSGVLTPSRLGLVRHLARATRRWGLTIGAAYAASAGYRPDGVAIIDELGPVTFAELDRSSDAIAGAFFSAGLAGKRVGLLCRNSRWFVEAITAAAKAGTDVVLLNTGFAGPQLADVADAERLAAVVHDDEFSAACASLPAGTRRYLAWHDGGGTDGAGPGAETLERLVADGAPAPVKPTSESRLVILTSGTTGRPKGANRSNPSSAAPGVALLSRIPLRTDETTVVAAPMFHSWGLAHLTIATLLGGTVVVRRRFDPEATLADVAAHRASVLAVVPVMLQRIMDLPEAVRRRSDTSSLRVVAASGSALPGPLATRFMDAFGDVLYNLYGSTEVAWATIATPEDLRRAPGTAGRPPRGTVVTIYDERGRPLPVGATGRIFVGNGMPFEGYTGGGGKEEIDGLLSTGDVGHFDESGLLFVEGRDDDMIVSGGENVFPAEVEDLLAAHPGVADVAVIGVPDDVFGQRLRAFVVARPDAPDGSRPTEAALKSHVREHLASHKVPRDIQFIDELPRNATGKVLRRELSRR